MTEPDERHEPAPNPEPPIERQTENWGWAGDPPAWYRERGER
jgi:hypothetical protein